ncbi:MAG: hypothetical protein KJZ84_16240 [Bryobacteraceae bacterium]|nr:hypothetical protein [Bryobacteraceae bacterium]
MRIADEETIAALVVLRPRGRPSGPPRVENLADWTPAPGTAEAATAILRQSGFTVEESGQGALRVSGSARLFRNVFSTELERSERGGVVTGSGSPDLPLESLPPSLGSLLAAAGFEQPPEFGPGGEF